MFSHAGTAHLKPDAALMVQEAGSQTSQLTHVKGANRFVYE
jgi:hypothetical protein